MHPRCVCSFNSALGWPGMGWWGVGGCIWLDTTQAEAQMPGGGDGGHVPDFLGTRAWEIGEM